MKYGNKMYLLSSEVITKLKSTNKAKGEIIESNHYNYGVFYSKLEATNLLKHLSSGEIKVHKGTIELKRSNDEVITVCKPDNSDYEHTTTTRYYIERVSSPCNDDVLEEAVRLFIEDRVNDSYYDEFNHVIHDEDKTDEIIAEIAYDVSQNADYLLNQDLIDEAITRSINSYIDEESERGIS